jgi:hypothetical protein
MWDDACFTPVSVPRPSPSPAPSPSPVPAPEWFSVLKGVTFSFSAWSVTPYVTATKDGTSLGSFASEVFAFDASCPSGARLDSHVLTGGAGPCPNGVYRNSVIKYVCASDGRNRIIDTAEPSMCSYVLTFAVDCSGNPFNRNSLCRQSARPPAALPALVDSDMPHRSAVGWAWTVKPYVVAYQKSPGVQSLGGFRSETYTADASCESGARLVSHAFGGGSGPCSNGAYRSAVVDYVCASDGRSGLVSASEPSMCSYRLVYAVDCRSGGSLCRPSPNMTVLVASNFTYGRSTELVWVARATGSKKQCGCFIGGRCYAHQTRHPSNACAVCDVVANPFGWTLNPVDCSDGQACTYDDQCVLVDALDEARLPVKMPVCRGQPYVCPRDTGDTIAARAMTCTLRSDCDGDNGCLTVPQPAGILCYNISARDVCMPPSFCDGVSPSCPAVTRNVPIVTAGAMTLVVLDATKGEDEPERYQLQPAAMPLAAGGSPYTHVLPVAATGWTTTCGWIEFAAGYYTVPDDSAGQCDVRKAVIRARPAPGLGGNRSNIMLVPLDDARYPVVDGTLVQLVVRTRNTDGIEKDACYPGAIVMDASRPLAGNVTNLHPDFPGRVLNPTHHYAATLAFTVAGFREEQAVSTWGGQLKYEYMVAAYPVDARVPSYWAVRTTPIGFATTAFTTLVEDATRYVVFVRAYNRAGLASAWAQGADVTIDRSAPRVLGEVTDMGWASGQLSPLTLQWAGVFAEGASPIDRFEVGWGTQRGNDNVVRYMALPPNQTSLVFGFNNR